MIFIWISRWMYLRRLLGGKEEIKTLSSKFNIKITQCTQNGKRVRLKGKGMPVYNKTGQFGGLYVKLIIRIPEMLTPEQRKALDSLSKE